MAAKGLFVVVSGAAVALTTVAAASFDKDDYAQNDVMDIVQQINHTMSQKGVPEQSRTTRAEYVYSYKKEWSKDAEYKGDYRNTRGDTVQYGEVNGKKLYWWAKFYSKGDIPGMFAPEGGTSPWVLINSQAYDPANSSSKYVWKGWNGQLESSLASGQAAVPTWRNGAEGAYTIIQDDIGAIPHETGILPGYEISKEFPDIRTGWGVFVKRANENAYWDEMQDMVRAGHEMVCHSYDHTSAAEQWAWGYVDSLLPTSVKDPNIPKSLGGLKVIGAPIPTKNPNDWAKAYTRIKVETELATIEYTANWTGVGPASNIGETVEKEKVQIKIEPVVVTPKPGVEKVSLLGVDYYVKYTKRDSINGENQGIVLATKVGWEDYDAAKMDASWQADGGKAVWVFKAKSSDSWADRKAFGREIKEATAEINKNVYDPIRKNSGFGNWFNPDKKTEYYVYPYDAYSEVTHDSIMNQGYVAARGGAKSGRPLPGDFFHPNRIDFDAFYMVDENHATLFPENPHSIMTLQGMVDSIVAQKGYMIRELHAIVDVTGKDWKTVNDNGQGGWWGGITTALYKKHMEYCQALINKHKLVVFTPSEAVRYRMTANNVNGEPKMTQAGDTWELTVPVKEWTNGDNRWEDEISVIVKLDKGVDKLDVIYKNGGHPYTLPRKMNSDGSAWSVNINPYKGAAVIHPGKEWSGVKVSTVSAAGNNVKSGISAKMIGKQLGLSLPAGTYGIQLFNARGQLIRSFAATSQGVASANQFAVDGIGAGLVIMRIKKDGQAIHSQSFMIQ